MRLLHPWHPDVDHRLSGNQSAPDRGRGARHAVRPHLPLHRLSGDRRRDSQRMFRRHARIKQGRSALMDLGTAFAFAVARRPDAEAFVEDGRRLTYVQWYAQIRAAGGGLRRMGLKACDHLIVVMRNRHEMATLYWACQLLGIIFTPVSWRASVDEIAYCLTDA